MSENFLSSLPVDEKFKPIDKLKATWKASMDDPDAFWSEQANRLDWFKTWDSVLEWENRHARWFNGGVLNASYNCLDRHVKTAKKNKVAYIWEGEMGEVRQYTYEQLYKEVNKFANVLKKLGVKKGDIVSLYMPVIPELPIAMLACARIGAPHSVVFAGFSAESLRDRMENAESKFLITVDGYYRRGKVLNHKQKSDEAVGQLDVTKVVVVKRGKNDISRQQRRLR